MIVNSFLYLYWYFWDNLMQRLEKIWREGLKNVSDSLTYIVQKNM